MPQDFVALTVKSNGRLRVLISDCQACAGFDPAKIPPSKQPKYKPFKAIWDTGATNSVITQAVVDACGLKATGMKQVHGVLSTDVAETFIVNMLLPNDVQFVNWVVTRGKLTGAEAEMLLGMDVITHGDFSITNVGGKTVFTFRVPSIQTVDYAAEARAIRTATQKRAKRKAKRSQKKRPPKWGRKR